MRTLLMALLLTTTSPVTPNYCEGFKTCSFDEKKLEIDVSEEENGIWTKLRIRDVAEDYCQTHEGADVIIHIQGGVALGHCGE